MRVTKSTSNRCKKMNALSELPVRQERFVAEFLTDMNGARAARAAGYSPHTARQIASEILTKPDVQGVIRARYRETEARLEVARDDCIRGLQAAYSEAKLQGDPMAMISAMREIGRMLGYYQSVRPAHEEIAEGTGQVGSVRMHSMSKQELLAIYQRGQ